MYAATLKSRLHKKDLYAAILALLPVLLIARMQWCGLTFALDTNAILLHTTSLEFARYDLCSADRQTFIRLL
jgi:hypothetical protein